MPMIKIRVHGCRASFRLLPGLIIVLFMLSGCTSSVSDRTITRMADGQLKRRVCRVVLLPFVNESRSLSLDVQAYRIFLTEIAGSGIFKVTPEGDLKNFLYRNRIRPDAIWDHKLVADLSRQLDVDGALVVYIRDSNLVRGSYGSRNTFISLQVELYDTDSGKLLLSSFLRRKGADYTTVLHFGVVDTVSGLLQQMAREIITIWQEEGVSGC